SGAAEVENAAVPGYDEVPHHLERALLLLGLEVDHALDVRVGVQRDAWDREAHSRGEVRGDDRRHEDHAVDAAVERALDLRARVRPRLDRDDGDVLPMAARAFED